MGWTIRYPAAGPPFSICIDRYFERYDSTELKNNMMGFHITVLHYCKPGALLIQPSIQQTTHKAFLVNFTTSYNPANHNSIDSLALGLRHVPQPSTFRSRLHRVNKTSHIASQPHILHLRYRYQRYLGCPHAVSRPCRGSTMTGIPRVRG